SENVYGRKSQNKNVLILAISSNRGLAGAFNSNIIKKTNQLINTEYKNSEVTVLPIGKKVSDAFKRTRYYIIGQDLPNHASLLFDKLSYENVSAVMEKVIAAYLNKDFDKVVVVYNQFRNAAVQVATEEQLLPVVANENNSKAAKTDYIFEPGQEFMVN